MVIFPSVRAGFTLGVSANEVCFERELLDHKRAQAVSRQSTTRHLQRLPLGRRISEPIAC
jgi:hypothetical protein